ncbi:siderophore-interacting protein [Actinomadura hallensis]|uniref:siderophore-interacting protein n=1 Tax=Actinomadura hallensis TaxID=337895 RepID=UPI001FE67847|nr:siderophore-interacting protein [Actinomadura hallensis]
MRNPLTVAFAKNIVEATITEADLVTPAMRRIRLEPDVPIPHVPGQHIRIEVNDPLSPRGLLRPLKTLRTYSVWAYDTKAIDMLAHLYDHDGGGGIGLRWAPGARPGDRVKFWRHQRTFTLRENVPITCSSARRPPVRRSPR